MKGNVYLHTKTKIITGFFLEILQRYWKLVTLDTLAMGAHRYPTYIHIKDQLYPHLFLEILQRYCRLVTLGIWHAWLPTLKMIELTCIKIWCLWACKKSISSLSSFLGLYTLTNPAIWLVKWILDHISGTRFFPDIGFAQEHSK